MADNEAKLVAIVTARLDTFEKQMKQAGVIADNTMKDVEHRMDTRAVALGTTLGRSLSRAIEGAMDAAINTVKEFIEHFQKIGDVAEVAGTSMRQAFSFEKVLGEGALKGLETVATQFDRMQRGEKNFLSKLFDENGVKNIKDAVQAMEKVVELIQNVAEGNNQLIRQREIGKALGIDDATVDRIRQMEGGFRNLRQAAAEAAPDLDKLKEKAAEFEALWKKAIDGVKTYLGAAMADMVTPVAEFVSSVASILSKLEGFRISAREGLGFDASGVRASQAGLESLIKTLDTFTQKRRAVSEDNREFGGKGFDAGGFPKVPGAGAGTAGVGGTKLPSIATGSRAAASEAETAFEREMRRAEERINLLEKETAMIGAGVEAKARAEEFARLENAAKRDGVTLEGEMLAKANERAAAVGRAVAAEKQANETRQKAIELQNFAGNLLISSIEQATASGAKLADVMANVAKALAHAALQALILGQGPLSNLFGTSGTAGAPGGAVGFLAALLKAGVSARATGGPVMAGQPYMVGERGPEIIVPGSAGRVIPNGAGGGVQFNQTIDARGAQAGVADQIVAALAANNRALQVTLPSMIRNAQGRGSLR